MSFFYTIIIYPITQIIEFVFVTAQNLFKETGLSVICVSVAISILCLPLYMIAEGWQEVERNIRKKLAPKINKIKSVFTGDEQYMILSTYYRQNHYHPVYALRSSFGLLIQIPFFIAAYTYLSHLEALQGAPFSFIKDLGKPDMLIALAGGINLLPIVMTAINCTSAAVYSRGLLPKDKIQLYGISLIFLVLLYNSPSGLVLYWTLNNIFSLLKNGYLKLSIKNKHYLLYSIISFISLLSFVFFIFIFHGNIRFRILLAVISVIIGITPWLIPFILKISRIIKPISWTSRESFSLFIFSALVLFTTSGILLPSMLIGASPQEFSYIDTVTSPLFFISNAAIQAFGLFFFWPLMIFFLLSPQKRNIFTIFMIIISFSALCNVFIFSGSYGPISDELVFTSTISHDLFDISVNTLVLIILITFIFIIYIKGGKKILSFLMITLFIALGSFSLKMIYSINKEFNKLSEYYTREEIADESINPIFHFSKTGNNVLVIMLDMAQNVFIPYIFEESPELKQKYDGFVYYPNTVTFNGWTAGGAPPIFGGYEYTPQGINNRPDVTVREKTNEALLLMPKIFSESGFSVTVTDPPYADGNWIPDLRIYDEQGRINAYITDGVYTSQWLKQNNILLPTHSDTLKRNILWYAIFREIPLAFRQAIYFNGSWCAPFSENRMRLFLNGYAVLDYLKELTVFETTEDNTVILLTNNTTHESLFLQAPVYKPQLNVTVSGEGRFGREIRYHANAAAIKLLADFFDFLKSNDAYDNTRIIMVSDHGILDNSFVTKNSLPFHVDQFNPILLLKDFNARGEIKTDMTFMSTADVPTLAMEGLIEDPVNPFTGNAINSNPKDDPLLILIHRVNEINEYEIELGPHNAYYVHDNIFMEKNWVKPGRLP